MYLAWQAVVKLTPDLYIGKFFHGHHAAVSEYHLVDTMGYAFTFHVASWLGSIPVGAYVHYPTISTDMLARVKSRKKWHTNADSISSSPVLTSAKLLYYRLFMYYYSLSLQRASFLMVNSSWTKNHIDAILQHSDLLLDAVHLFLPSLLLRNALRTSKIVYPPCDTKEMARFSLEGRDRFILSIAQFR